MVDINIPNFIESWRKKRKDDREAKAVGIAKLRLSLEFAKERSYRRSNERRHLLNALEIEVDAATTKEDIKEIINKLNRIRGVAYPK